MLLWARTNCNERRVQTNKNSKQINNFGVFYLTFKRLWSCHSHPSQFKRCFVLSVSGFTDPVVYSSQINVRRRHCSNCRCTHRGCNNSGGDTSARCTCQPRLGLRPHSPPLSCGANSPHDVNSNTSAPSWLPLISSNLEIVF